MKKFHPRLIYPLLGMFLPTLATTAQFFDLKLSWLVLALISNVFIGAGVVSGTESRSVQRFNPKSRFFEDEPETVDAVAFRIPFLPVIMALIVSVLMGVYFESPLQGLLTLFTWGGLGYPLALCVLYRASFGTAMQVGLISSVGYTAAAGALHIYRMSPKGSFQPMDCLTQIMERMTVALTQALEEAKVLYQQTLAEMGTINEPPLQGVNVSSLSAAETADALVKNLLLNAPSLFTVAILFLLCIVWWGMKEALKRDSFVETKYMGRLDGYTPSRALSLLLSVSFVTNLALNLFGLSGSGIQIAAMNLSSVLLTVFTFAGFSLLLYIIRTKTKSSALRVVLSIAAAVLGVSSCGNALLLVLGLFSAGRDLRGTFGGGTFK